MVTMQQVWPDFGPVDHADVYELAPRPQRPDRPWVVLCMVTSVDGAVSVRGRSAPLGGPADRAVLCSLRAAADAVVVGAGTARAEDYGAPAVGGAEQQRRRRRGQEPQPLLAVVSARGDLDPAARLFAGPAPPRLYLAADAPAGRREALAEVAEVRTAGAGQVEPGEVLADLGAEGRSLILLEGGPHLNAHFARAGLIDEFCVTRSPLLAGEGPGMLAGEGPGLLAGEGPGLLSGAPPAVPQGLHLDRLLVADGMVFARYLRAAGDQVPG